jgi:hypothetical protein
MFSSLQWKPLRIILLCSAVFWMPIALNGQGTTPSLRQTFANPPDSARPWVYWFWLNSNVSKEGITADLEAMKRVGIGGVLIMDVDQGTPPGPVKFMDNGWRELFHHAAQEAKRLGMEINMNNGVGYFGSGGPWIPPEKAQQTVVASEQHVTGGQARTLMLARPVNRPDYRDIAVLAVKEPLRKPNERFKIPNFPMKSLRWQGWVNYSGLPAEAPVTKAPPEACIDPASVVDLTSKMQSDGKLVWDAPAGEWTILRIGHAYSGAVVGPALNGQNGPCLDQMNASATALHFSSMVKPLRERAKQEGDDSFVAVHIDSWEGGGQNWTASMRDEFIKRRGYDPVPFLPVLTERVIGDLDRTERFLRDLRQTASELIVENYIAPFQRLAHENGLRLTFECYTTGGNDLDQAAYVDEPMAEFWTDVSSFFPTTKSMSSSAHLNGRAVVGAEAFTSGNSERWLRHPASIKALGDQALCNGVNRFVFHRYAAQRFPNVVPGLQMGPWGLHYERTNTWWDWSLPWHTYLARCQHLLRQGRPCADVLYVPSEEPLERAKEIQREGFDDDICGPELLKQAKVRDGRIVMPGGASYRLLYLEKTDKMTLERLRLLTQLLEDGAVVLGEPPVSTPGLQGLPKADEELRAMVANLWGKDPATTRTVGKGKLLRGLSPAQALTQLGVGPDFTSDRPLNWIHRSLPDAEIYFVANNDTKPVQTSCTFRVSGKRPELWDPESGRISPFRCYDDSKPGLTRLSLPLGPGGSAFVVFTSEPAEKERLVDVTLDGKPILKDGVLTSPANGAMIDPVHGSLLSPGSYSLTSGDHLTRSVVIPPVTPPVEISGPWMISFPPGKGAPDSITIENLTSWSNHPEDGVKHFSGTATYTKKIVLTPEQLKGQRLFLDLGRVEVMARVKCNGRDLGILWKPPYSVEITEAAKPGENELEISVVNLWPNRLIGDERLPEDSMRNVDAKTKQASTLKEWPEWLLNGKPSPAGRQTFCSWRLWHTGDALVDSGLIGPVKITFVPESATAP